MPDDELVLIEQYIPEGTKLINAEIDQALERERSICRELGHSLSDKGDKTWLCVRCKGRFARSA
ncbi:MAG TPA: hypothetical protein VFU19_11510 [Iamia sp.]|nr:hypothetical protein [Iamia sp.]